MEWIIIAGIAILVYQYGIIAAVIGFVLAAAGFAIADEDVIEL